jgi:hypothetical protein
MAADPSAPRINAKRAILAVLVAALLVGAAIAILGQAASFSRLGVYWAADMLTLYAALRLFGARPEIIPLVLVYASSFVISALPLPAGGAKGIEASMTLALHTPRDRDERISFRPGEEGSVRA